MKVTSIKDLREYAKGAVVELPEFAEGQPFVARLKRPSIMDMARSGKIPNALLVRANELFTNSAGLNPNEENMMSELMDVMEAIAAESFVEPTYQEIKESGVTLTDQQLMAVFNYTQNGVKALQNFRTEQEN